MKCRGHDIYRSFFVAPSYTNLEINIKFTTAPFLVLLCIELFKRKLHLLFSCLLFIV